MRCSVITLLSGLIIGLSSGSIALAEPKMTALTASDEITTEGEVAQLRQAYVYLEAGNHNYHGHRIKALRAVGAACHALGFPAKGDGKNHENQTFSDNLLDSAHSLLLGVLPHCQAKQQKDAVLHIQHAIQEVELAMEKKQGPPSPPSSSPGTKGK